MALCDDEDIYDASLSFLESLNTLEVTENRLRRTMGDSKLDEDRREELAIEVKATRDKEEKLHREELKRFQVARSSLFIFDDAKTDLDVLDRARLYFNRRSWT